MGTIGCIIAIFAICVLVIDCFSKQKYISTNLNNKTTTTIKGIAIFIVILSHISGNLGSRLLTPLGGIGVSVFLIFSGFGIEKSYRRSNNLQYYWRKRFISIYPAYILTNIAVWIIRGADLRTIFLSMTFLEPSIPYGWYFHYLLFWYFVFWLSKVIFQGRYCWGTIIVAAILSFCFSPEIMAEQSLSFAVGVFICEREKSLISGIDKTKRTILLFLFLLFGVAFLGFKQLDVVRQAPQLLFNAVQLLIKLPIAISIVLFALVSVSNNRIKFKLFYLMGVISYEMYLVHGICINWFHANRLFIVLFALLTAIMISTILHFINCIVQSNLRKVLIK